MINIDFPSKLKEAIFLAEENQNKQLLGQKLNISHFYEQIKH